MIAPEKIEQEYACLDLDLTDPADREILRNLRLARAETVKPGPLYIRTEKTCRNAESE